MSSSRDAARRRAALNVIGLVVIGVLVAVFLATFERVEEEVDLGYSGEARLNPFRALELLLADQGFEARTARAEWTLPRSPKAALLLLGPRRTMSHERVSEVLEWVSRGGRLVVTPAGAHAEDREYLVDLESGPRKADAPAPPRKQADEEEEEEDEHGEKAPPQTGKEMGLPDPILDLFGIRTTWRRPESLTFAPAPGSDPVHVLPGTGVRLVVSRDAALLAGPPEAAFLARYPYGKGSVTVLADATCLVNHRIGLQQHADLSVSLLADSGSEVLVVFRDDMPPLALLLVTKGWAAVLTGLLLLAIWLWGSGGRFGPLVGEKEPGRRSLREHLLASGRFLWESGRTDDLLADCRRALTDRLRSRRPEWVRLPHRELVRRLAQEAALPHARVDRALSGAGGRERFLESLQTLEILRRSL